MPGDDELPVDETRDDAIIIRWSQDTDRYVISLEQLDVLAAYTILLQAAAALWDTLDPPRLWNEDDAPDQLDDEFGEYG